MLPRLVLAIVHGLTDSGAEHCYLEFIEARPRRNPRETPQAENMSANMSAAVTAARKAFLIATAREAVSEGTNE